MSVSTTNQWAMPACIEGLYPFQPTPRCEGGLILLFIYIHILMMIYFRIIISSMMVHYFNNNCLSFPTDRLGHASWPILYHRITLLYHYQCIVRTTAIILYYNISSPRQFACRVRLRCCIRCHSCRFSVFDICRFEWMKASQAVQRSSFIPIMCRIDFTQAAGVCQCVAVGLLLSGSGVSCVLSSFLRNANEYACLDERWIESCAIGYGSVFSGTRYRQSATGQSCIDGVQPFKFSFPALITVAPTLNSHLLVSIISW